MPFHPSAGGIARRHFIQFFYEFFPFFDSIDGQAPIQRFRDDAPAPEFFSESGRYDQPVFTVYGIVVLAYKHRYSFHPIIVTILIHYTPFVNHYPPPAFHITQSSSTRYPGPH